MSLTLPSVAADSDPDPKVRDAGAGALGKLMQLSPRVDPLVNELVNGLNKAEEGVKTAMLSALASVMKFAGSKVSAPMLTKAEKLLKDLIYDDQKDVRKLAASAYGSLLGTLAEDSRVGVVEELENCDGEWMAMQGLLLTLTSLADSAPASLVDLWNRMQKNVGSAMTHERDDVRVAAMELAGALLCSVCALSMACSISFLYLCCFIFSSSARQRMKASPSQWEARNSVPCAQFWLKPWSPIHQAKYAGLRSTPRNSWGSTILLVCLPSSSRSVPGTSVQFLSASRVSGV